MSQDDANASYFSEPAAQGGVDSLIQQLDQKSKESAAPRIQSKNSSRKSGCVAYCRRVTDFTGLEPLQKHWAIYRVDQITTPLSAVSESLMIF